MNKLKTVGIVLAAGRSTRMGTKNKLLCPINNLSIIEHSLDSFAKSNVAEIILVLGFEADTIANMAFVKKLQDQNKLSIVLNKNYKNGMGTSIAAAVKHLSDDTDACIIGLGDMPFINSHTINMLISSAQENSKNQIFRPQFMGKKGHPILWKQQFFQELANLSHDRGGKDIIANNKELLFEVTVDDKAVLEDVDTPEKLDSFNK